MPQIGWIWSGSQTINKGASYTIILPAPQPVGAPPPPYYLGTLGIYSTAAGYSVDVHTGTEWISVVTSGSTNASYPVSGVGLRITAPNAANSPSSITVKYVFVSVPTPMEAPSH